MCNTKCSHNSFWHVAQTLYLLPQPYKKTSHVLHNILHTILQNQCPQCPSGVLHAERETFAAAAVLQNDKPILHTFLHNQCFQCPPGMLHPISDVRCCSPAKRPFCIPLSITSPPLCSTDCIHNTVSPPACLHPTSNDFAAVVLQEDEPILHTVLHNQRPQCPPGDGRGLYGSQLQHLHSLRHRELLHTQVNSHLLSCPIPEQNQWSPSFMFTTCWNHCLPVPIAATLTFYLYILRQSVTAYSSKLNFSFSYHSCQLQCLSENSGFDQSCEL